MIIRLLRFIALTSVLAFAAAGAGFSQPAYSIEGSWQGTLEFGGVEYRIAVVFKKKTAATYTGTFQSLDQSSQVFPMDVVTYTGDSLHFDLKAASGSWQGKVSEGALTGKWTQHGSSAQLNFKRAAAAAALLRPQEPKRPYPYTEIEVLYPNRTANIKLGGTLTEPKEKGPFPAVLLITGSGQQDRNEEVFGHKPFLVIADYLTRRGIAVLRVDDRGIGKSTGDFAKSTTEDFATDVEAGIAFLKSRKEIRRDRIGLIGHSEGGIIAPMIAARSKDVAFIVMLAGSGVPGSQILTQQAALIAKAGGAKEAAIKFNSQMQEKMFAIVAAEKDPPKADARLNALIETSVLELPSTQRQTIKTELLAAARQLNSPWMRFFLTYDPASALKKVQCPVLVMSGEKDMQVPPAQNLPAIEAALKDGGNKAYSIKLMPSLNHLFQTCRTGSPAEYVTIQETFAPIALKTMGDWIIARVSH